jgi:50S ribosomal protein L16 3-hydroxylase
MPHIGLGGLSPAAFLRRHWQKRPLLARSAWQPGEGLPDLDRLVALACRSDVESRRVSRRGRRWALEHGPFHARQFRNPPARNWTLLVNGVDQHVPAVEQLMRRFEFLPRARMDDVMVSYAAPGGGVGPHEDSYDVFLLQGAGRRLWRLQRPGRFARVPASPLRQIADFEPDTEYLVEPGDILYLPPGWGHDGVALEPCWTFSVGCRAPRGAELALALLDYLHERGLPDARYRDPGLRPAANPAQIGRALVNYAQRTLRKVRWSANDVTRVLGCHLTLPKPHVVFEPRERVPPRAAFLRQLAGAQVALDARSQLLYRGAEFFLNGDVVPVSARQRRPLARLADERRAAGAHLARAGLGALLREWYAAGAVHLERGS